MKRAVFVDADADFLAGRDHQVEAIARVVERQDGEDRARVGDQGDAAGLELGGRIEARVTAVGDVEKAHGVAAADREVGLPGLVPEPRQDRPACVVLAVAGIEHHHGAGAAGQGLIQHRFDPAAADAGDDQVGYFRQARQGAMARRLRDLAISGIDEIDRATETTGERRLDHGQADRAGPRRGADLFRLRPSLPVRPFSRPPRCRFQAALCREVLAEKRCE
jgi:hypothetical protein